MALMVTKELAQELHCSECTVRRMVHDGRIPDKYMFKVGNDYRFNGPAILELFQVRRNHGQDVG